jgi:dihydropteroate synthase
MTINCRGHLLDLSTPKIMGILNITPDSFYDGGRYGGDETALLHKVNQMLHEGADIIDLGGMSTRPGADIISPDEEIKRVAPALELIIKQFPRCVISIDTIHAQVAEEALSRGAHIVNDISAGRYDANMLATAAEWKAPFVILHMQGLPVNMQEKPHYLNVVTEVYDFFRQRMEAYSNAGITDIMLDPGFGFGKSVDHNFTLLRELSYFSNLRLPLLAGLSRKAMICKTLKVNPQHALNGTTAAHMLALINGANILRVHDVKEARQAVQVFEACYAPVNAKA